MLQIKIAAQAVALYGTQVRIPSVKKIYMAPQSFSFRKSRILLTCIKPPQLSHSLKVKTQITFLCEINVHQVLS